MTATVLAVPDQPRRNAANLISLAILPVPAPPSSAGGQTTAAALAGIGAARRRSAQTAGR